MVSILLGRKAYAISTAHYIFQIFFNADEWPEVCEYLKKSLLDDGWGRGGNNDYRLRCPRGDWEFVHARGFDSVIQLDHDNDSHHRYIERLHALFGFGHFTVGAGRQFEWRTG